MSAISEAAFQNQVIQLAQTLGYDYHHETDSRKSPSGWPDLVLWRAATRSRSGRIIFAELKTETGKLKPEQKTKLASLVTADAEVYLWRPRNLDDIKKILACKARPTATVREILDDAGGGHVSRPFPLRAVHEPGQTGARDDREQVSEHCQRRADKHGEDHHG